MTGMVIKIICEMKKAKAFNVKVSMTPCVRKVQMTRIQRC